MGADLLPRLPSYRNPPLEEVALAVQLQPEALDYLLVAHLYEALRDELPERQEQPARPPMLEDFASPAPSSPFSIEIVPAAAMPRFWLLSKSHTRLLQLQHDLVAYNWRRSPDPDSIAETYPRYSALRSEFVGHLDRLRELAAQDGRDLLPNWCEVTYINHVAGDQESRPPLRSLMRGLEGFPAAGFLPEPEDGQLACRFRIGDPAEPVGRLNVNVAPAIRRADMAMIWILTLTTRIKLAEESIEFALDALDAGREWVVRGFDELTSEEMHATWQKEDDDGGR